MKPSRRQQSQPDDSGGFNERSPGFWLPPPAGRKRTMSRIDGSGLLNPNLMQSAHDFAKPIASISYWEQCYGICGPNFAPSARNRTRHGVRIQGSLKLIRRDKNIHLTRQYAPIPHTKVNATFSGFARWSSHLALFPGCGTLKAYLNYE
jgi:hypothetical protein